MTKLYRDPVRCAEAIVDRVGREILLAMPICIGKPNLLVNALYRLAEADRTIKLHIFTGLSLVRPRYGSDLEKRFVEPLLGRLFGSWPDLEYAEAMRRNRLPSNIQVSEFFVQAGQWLNNDAMQQSYASLSYSHVAAHLQRNGVNVLAQLVAPPPDGDGQKLSLSSNTDITLDLVPYLANCRRSPVPIASVGEVNCNLPYMPGEAEVSRDWFDFLLEPDAPHYALFAPPKQPVSAVDYAMALHAATLVKDGGTLQIGIGSFADALTQALILRHTRNDEFRRLVACLGAPLHPDAQLGTFEAGLYGCSEMLVDGFLTLRRAGILKRAVADASDDNPARPVLVHAGFFFGNEAFYNELRHMPRADLEQIVMTAISFTNTLSGDTDSKAAQRRDARFINTGMTATLLGAVSSDQLEDGRVVSGIGGQAEFVQMAHELPDARSVLAVRSTRSSRGKPSSNIVWRYANTSIPRYLRDIIVTEYGIADICGLSDAQCIEAMLAVSDSAFQQRLKSEAATAHKLRRGYALPSWATSNSRARLEAALEPARKAGLLPAFPLGSEMTGIEQQLAGLLSALREASGVGRLQALARGFGRSPLGETEREAMTRMGLECPKSLKERIFAGLLLGALRSPPR
ncbi:MAG: acetyl-CoA hydrolase/transferase C-terminal domain-containing protein [Hyphomicrobiaceae bacterium]